VDELKEITIRARDFLEMAVGLEIAEISRSGLEISDWHIEEAQRRMSATRMSGAGEELMFRLPDTQRSMRDLIEALVIMAHMPGGVEFAGLRFCANQTNTLNCVEKKYE
jgi:hypothetical protein